MDPSYQEESENPLYETSAEVNPLYEPSPTKEPLTGPPSDMNPLYEASPEMNPLYEPSPTKESLTGPSSDMNPLYEASPEMNPLYEPSPTKESLTGPSSDMNPLYEASPEMNPLYEPSPSVHRHLNQPNAGAMWHTEAPNNTTDLNPLYEGTSDVNPLYEPTPSADSGLRRRADSRSKPGRVRSGSRARANTADDEESLIPPETPSQAPLDAQSLGLVNQGVDVTVNELYDSLPVRDEQKTLPPIPARRHVKRS